MCRKFNFSLYYVDYIEILDSSKLYADSISVSKLATEEEGYQQIPDTQF